MIPSYSAVEKTLKNQNLTNCSVAVCVSQFNPVCTVHVLSKLTTCLDEVHSYFFLSLLSRRYRHAVKIHFNMHQILNRAIKITICKIR